MVAVVVDSPFRSATGRKPRRAAFLWDLHRVTTADTVILDRFGNADTLTLSAAAGTAWTAAPGWFRGDGTTQRFVCTGGAQQNYAGQTVMDCLTAGGGFVVGWRFGWAGTKPSATEGILCLGRGNSTSAQLQFGFSAGAILNVIGRGVGASANTAWTFGSSGDYSATADMSALFHVAPSATGVKVLAWLNGVPIGQEREILWTDNGGTRPAASVFAMPDGITVGASRGGSSAGAPTFTQYMGASNAGGSRLANLLGVNLGAANAGTAQDLALEVAQYPRYVGEILGSL